MDAFVSWVAQVRKGAVDFLTRAPGSGGVVRPGDPGAPGKRPPTWRAALGLLSLAIAVAMVAWVGFGFYQMMTHPLPATVFATDGAVFEKAARPEGEQRQQARQRLEEMYDALVTFGENYRGDSHVAGQTLGMYEALVLRAQKEKLSSYRIGALTKVSIGAWKTTVVETTSKGTHAVDFTLTLRLDFRPGVDAKDYDFTPDWIIENISGEGLVPAP